MTRGHPRKGHTLGNVSNLGTLSGRWVPLERKWGISGVRDAELGPQMLMRKGWCLGLLAMCPNPGATWGTEEVEGK